MTVNKERKTSNETARTLVAFFYGLNENERQEWLTHLDKDASDATCRAIWLLTSAHKQISHEDAITTLKRIGSEAATKKIGALCYGPLENVSRCIEALKTLETETACQELFHIADFCMPHDQCKPGPAERFHAAILALEKMDHNVAEKAIVKLGGVCEGAQQAHEQDPPPPFKMPA